MNNFTDEQKEKMGCKKQKLYTKDGGLAATVWLLPYRTPPDAIMWGQRFFVNSGGEFVEGLFIHVEPGSEVK